MPGRWHVLEGDCREVLRRLPAESFDSVVTDPPAGISFMSRDWDSFADRDDKGRTPRDRFVEFLTEVFREVLRVLKPGGHAIVWSLPRTSHWTAWAVEDAGFEIRDRVPELARLLKPSGHLLVFCHHESYAAFYPYIFAHFPKLVALVWDKGRAGLGRVWRHQHEFVIAARGKQPHEAKGRLFVDVLHHRAPLTRDRRHPAEKPVPLLRELLEATCPAGGLVLDPFMGSGSTGEAALSTGRRFVGIEKDAAYFADTDGHLRGLFPVAWGSA